MVIAIPTAPKIVPRQNAQHGHGLPSAEKIRAGSRSGVSQTKRSTRAARQSSTLRPNCPSSVSSTSRDVSAKAEPFSVMIWSSSDWKSRLSAGSKRTR